MPVPAHLSRFIQINAATRVAMLCRSLGVQSGRLVETYTRAVVEAVHSMAGRDELSVRQVDACLDDQLALLKEAIGRPVPPLTGRVPTREPAPGEPDAPQRSRRRAQRSQQASADQEPRSMEDKLEEARQPLRNILQQECVQLGLITPQRAQKLAAQLSGKLRQEAEAEIVAELRDNLREHIRIYIRKHQGGPWNSPKLQEDVRLDIANTNSVHSVVVLTRHLLQERKQWEDKFKKGLFHNLLGGRLKISPEK
jgi:hypothetical protein